MSTSFAYTNGYRSFAVPAGMYAMEVDLYGAQGQEKGYYTYSPTVYHPYPGGLGGRLKTTIAVVPGEILRVYVGGAGNGAVGGFNGGGDGDNLSGGAAGGGGATDVRRAPYGVEDRLAVAGGGGGSGDFGSGGAGGGPVGQDGTADGYGGTTHGQGGTQTAGGLNGNGDPSGGLGYGGSAIHTNPGGYGQGCAGGGGGYYGGGAGGPNAWNEGASAGGGSSWSSGTISIDAQGVQTGAGMAILGADPDWMLEFELSTQDLQGQKDLSLWDVYCNDEYVGQATSPPTPRNDLPTDPRDASEFWQLNQFPLATFSPTVNNHIAMGYVGGADYGHIRHLRVVGPNDSTYYGEYPIGFAYGRPVYYAYHRNDLNALYGVNNNGSGYSNLWLCGDGDYPPYQWNAQTKDYDTYPLGPDGLQSGLAHFYFTVLDSHDLVYTVTDLVGRRDSTIRTRVVGQTVQLDQSASNAVFNPRPTGG